MRNRLIMEIQSDYCNFWNQFMPTRQTEVEILFPLFVKRYFHLLCYYGCLFTLFLMYFGSSRTSNKVGRAHPEHRKFRI